MLYSLDELQNNNNSDFLINKLYPLQILDKKKIVYKLKKITKKFKHIFPVIKNIQEAQKILYIKKHKIDYRNIDENLEKMLQGNTKNNKSYKNI